MSKYGLLDPGTCLPVLEAITHVFDIDESLEFGAGIWSTFCLTRNCNAVTSIENVEEWIDTIRENYSHKNNLNIVHWTKPMNEYLKETDKNFDLIFVDGNDRIECLNDSINRSPIIVCHDTHRVELGWINAIIPEYYKQLTYVGCEPYLTTIFYHESMDLKSTLLDINNFNHKGTFVDRQFWSEDNIIQNYKFNNETINLLK